MGVDVFVMSVSRPCCQLASIGRSPRFDGASRRAAVELIAGKLQSRDRSGIDVAGMNVESLATFARTVGVNQGEVVAATFIDRRGGGVDGAGGNQKCAGCD